MNTKRERAVVSGATSGIGRAVAVRLARRGAIVGIVGRNADAAASVADEVKRQGGVPEVLIADVSRPERVEAAIRQYTAKHGGLDTVVASAGIAITAPMAEFSIDDWDRIVATNLSGTFYLARYTLPALLDSKGTFTAVGSDAGSQGAQGYGPYCATKHGVNGLIRCMALEYGPRGVRSNAVCPSFVETPMADRIFAGMSDAELDYFRKTVPLGRFARAEEVAEVVAHLTSPEAAYTNGLIYALDGGATAGYFTAPS